MKLVAAIRNVISIWNWNANAVVLRARHPPTTSCLTINATPPRPVQVTAIPIRTNRMGNATLAAEALAAVAAVVVAIHIITRRQMSHPHPVAPHHAYCSNMKCICGILWPKAWTPNRTACIHLKLYSHKAWRIWVSKKLRRHNKRHILFIYFY